MVPYVKAVSFANRRLSLSLGAWALTLTSEGSPLSAGAEDSCACPCREGQGWAQAGRGHRHCSQSSRGWGTGEGGRGREPSFSDLCDVRSSREGTQWLRVQRAGSQTLKLLPQLKKKKEKKKEKIKKKKNTEGDFFVRFSSFLQKASPHVCPQPSRCHALRNHCPSFMYI